MGDAIIGQNTAVAYEQFMKSAVPHKTAFGNASTVTPALIAHELHRPEVTMPVEMAVVNPDPKIPAFVDNVLLLCNSPYDSPIDRPTVVRLPDANGLMAAAHQQYFSELENKLSGRTSSVSGYSYEKADPKSGIRYLVCSASEFFSKYSRFGFAVSPDARVTPQKTVNGTHVLLFGVQFEGLLLGAKQVFTPSPTQGMYVGYMLARAIPPRGNLALSDIEPYYVTPYAKVDRNFHEFTGTSDLFLGLAEAIKREKRIRDSDGWGLVKPIETPGIVGELFKYSASVISSGNSGFAPLVGEVTGSYRNGYSVDGRCYRDVLLTDLSSRKAQQFFSSEHELNRPALLKNTPLSLIEHQVFLTHTITCAPIIQVGCMVHLRGNTHVPSIGTVQNCASDIESFVKFNGICDIDVTTH